MVLGRWSVRLHRSRTAAPSPPRPRAPSHARVTVRFLSVCVSVLFVADPRHASQRACSYGKRRRRVVGLVALLLLSGASSSAPHTRGRDGGLLRPLNGAATRGGAFVAKPDSAVVAGREADVAVRTRPRVNTVWMELSGDQRSGPLEPKGFARGGTNSAKSHL